MWGNNEKISLRVPTELRFHDLTLDSKPLSVAKTSWVNYCFDDERGECCSAERGASCRTPLSPH